MKRLLTILLSCTLIWGAAACSSDSSPSSPEAEGQASSKASVSPASSQKASSGQSSAASGDDSASSAGAAASADSHGSSTGSSAGESAGSASSKEAEPQNSTVTVTITEGESLTDIFKDLDAAGVASFDGLMDAAESYDFSYYPLVGAIPNASSRCFLLEGYLYPDTYQFYTNEAPENAIGRFLKNGANRITDADFQRAANLGYSMDEVLTVASLIQREGSNPNEVANIAAIIYNRLNGGMQLQMDATIDYIENDVIPYYRGNIDPFRALYNTYKCDALPAGPICSPGRIAIDAALYPADVPYLFFCQDADANYYYATTYEEHEANVKKAGLA